MANKKITIYYSDRIESLKDKLIENVGQGAEVFGEREIVVPNGNLGKWLKIEFARKQGVAMGLSFPFLDKALFQAMAGAVPEFDENPVRLIDREALTLGIGKVLAEGKGDAAFAPFYDYCGIGKDEPVSAALAKADVARKFWQLAGCLAGYLQEYDCRRTADMDSWVGELDDPARRDNYRTLKGAAADSDKLVVAQKALFVKLFGADGMWPSATSDRLSLRQVFNHFKKSDANSLAGRKFVIFGVSTIAPLQAEIIYQLARHGAEVELYYMTVCMEYWGDVKSPWERIKAAKELKDNENFVGLDMMLENDLLSALGTAGRETMRLFVDLEESLEVPVEMVPCGEASSGEEKKPSLLERIQSGVRQRVNAGDVKVSQDTDGSVQVVRAPGIRREVEMVYNSILGSVLDTTKSVAKEGDACKRYGLKGYTGHGRGSFSFSDIAVLVTDMHKYRPVIKEVFESRDEIPYGIIDGKAGEESCYAAGLAALLALRPDEFTRSGVLAVLGNPCVQAARHFSADDFGKWVTLVDKLGIHHGFSDDAPEGSAAVLSGSRAFSWNYGLKRVRLGKILSGATKNVELGIPYTDIDSEDCGEALSVVVEDLHDAVSKLRAEASRTMAEWKAAISDTLAEGWLAVPDSRKEEFLLEKTVDAALRRLEETFAPEAKWPLEMVSAYLRESVGELPAEDQGKYLISGVTVAALQPMRPLPFKHVYILGLGEREFPGAQSLSRLNIKQYRKCLGDATVQNINRHLFLETVMCARERLVLSYDGEDTAKDEKKYPSSVVRRIEEYLKDYALGGAEFREVELPLLERDARSVCAAAKAAATPEARVVTTYSRVQREQARVVAAEEAKNKETTSEAEKAKVGGVSVPRPPVTVTVHQLAEFFKNPRKGWLQGRLRIHEQARSDIRQANDEPIEADSYLFYGTGDKMVRMILDKSDASTEELRQELETLCRAEYAQRVREGKVPGGIFEEYNYGWLLDEEIDALMSNKKFAAFRATHPVFKRQKLEVSWTDKLPDGTEVTVTGGTELFWPAEGDRSPALLMKRPKNKENLSELLVLAAVAAASGKITSDRVDLFLVDKAEFVPQEFVLSKIGSFAHDLVMGYLSAADWALLPVNFEDMRKAYHAATAAKEVGSVANPLSIDKSAALLSADARERYDKSDRASPVKNIMETLSAEHLARMESALDKYALLCRDCFDRCPGFEQRKKTPKKDGETAKKSGEETVVVTDGEGTEKGAK